MFMARFILYMQSQDGTQYDRRTGALLPIASVLYFCLWKVQQTFLYFHYHFLSDCSLPYTPQWNWVVNEQLSIALELARGMDGFRFTNIGDIGCDIGVLKCTICIISEINIFYTERIGIHDESYHPFTTILLGLQPYHCNYLPFR